MPHPRRQDLPDGGQGPGGGLGESAARGGRGDLQGDGQVNAGNGFRIMAYDVPGSAPAAATPAATTRENGMTLTGERFFVSVRGETAEEVAALWEKLADGADLIEKYGPSQWAPGFGMLTDRFGVTWILDVTTPNAG